MEFRQHIFSLFLTFCLVLLLVSTSCGPKNPPIDEGGDAEIPDDTTTLVSLHNEKRSHNTGKKCQTCHVKGGNGKGWFSISGTVYDSTMHQVFPNATVFFYDGLTNADSLIVTVEVDSLGNFYSTEPIDYKNGLHVEVEGKSMTTKMGSLIHSAACNKCHGVITNYIWVK